MRNQKYPEGMKKRGRRPEQAVRSSGKSIFDFGKMRNQNIPKGWQLLARGCVQDEFYESCRYPWKIVMRFIGRVMNIEYQRQLIEAESNPRTFRTRSRSLESNDNPSDDICFAFLSSVHKAPALQ
jgi:hypothetical protein